MREQNKLILDLVSNDRINWLFVKLCALYKYAGIFV